MVKKNVYTFYVSHSWTYGNALKSLVEFFAEDKAFLWRGYAISRDNPVHTLPTTAALEEAIRERMTLSNALLIMAGKYRHFSKWIQLEIAVAQDLKKPVLVITPWGRDSVTFVERTGATAIVGWHASCLYEAIGRYVSPSEEILQDGRKYLCKVCGHIYDPMAHNNVYFEQLHDDWCCPICGLAKHDFEPMPLESEISAMPGVEEPWG